MDLAINGRNTIPRIVRKTNFEILIEQYSLEFQVVIFEDDVPIDFRLCVFSKVFPSDEILINIGAWANIVEPIQSFLRKILAIDGVDELIISESEACINSGSTVAKQTQTEICELILDTWKPLVHSVDNDGEIMITTAD